MDTPLAVRNTCPRASPAALGCCDSHWWRWRAGGKSSTSRNRRTSCGISGGLGWRWRDGTAPHCRWWGNKWDRGAVPWGVLSVPRSDRTALSLWRLSPTFCKCGAIWRRRAVDPLYSEQRTVSLNLLHQNDKKPVNLRVKLPRAKERFLSRYRKHCQPCFFRIFRYISSTRWCFYIQSVACFVMLEWPSGECATFRSCKVKITSLYNRCLHVVRIHFAFKRYDCFHSGFFVRSLSYICHRYILNWCKFSVGQSCRSYIYMYLNF